MTPINNNQMSELREKQAVIIANMVYEYQGADKDVQAKQTGKVYAGQTLEEIISHERAEAVRGLYDFCDNEVKEKKLSSEHCLLIKLVIEEYLKEEGTQ